VKILSFGLPYFKYIYIIYKTNTMPPKKVEPKKGTTETVAAPVEGAKFANVLCGSKDSDIKLLVNINCRLDILLDYIRTEFLKSTNTKITELKALGINPPAVPGMHSKPGSPKSTARITSANTARPASPGNVSADPNIVLLEERMSRLCTLQSSLTSTSVTTLDLSEEGGANLNCKTVSIR
jgi:hypothetical protein